MRGLAGAFAVTAALVALQTVVYRFFATTGVAFNIAFFVVDAAIVVLFARLASTRPEARVACALAGFAVMSDLASLASLASPYPGLADRLAAAELPVAFAFALVAILALRGPRWASLVVALVLFLTLVVRAPSEPSVTRSWISFALTVARHLSLAVVAWSAVTETPAPAPSPMTPYREAARVPVEAPDGDPSAATALRDYGHYTIIRVVSFFLLLLVVFGSGATLAISLVALASLATEIMQILALRRVRRTLMDVSGLLLLALVPLALAVLYDGGLAILSLLAGGHAVGDEAVFLAILPTLASYVSMLFVALALRRRVTTRTFFALVFAEAALLVASLSSGTAHVTRSGSDAGVAIVLLFTGAFVLARFVVFLRLVGRTRVLLAR